MSLPLFSRWPELRAHLPFVPLATAPTPVERAAVLAPALGRDDLWVKRDDLVSPLYGGNKVRRFELLFGEARARGAERLLTVGGLASTQVTATALHGRASDFAVTAVLFDQPVTDFAKRAVRANLAAGAELVYGGGYAATVWRTLLALRAKPRTYFIPPGASSPLANLGYVGAMFELADQVERGELPRPDVIVVPTGSAGTLVGLGLGAALLGWPTELIGVRITARIACNRLTVRWLERATRRYLLSRVPALTDAPWPALRFRLFQRAVGRGYGYGTPAAERGADLITSLTGVPGEVTYSGKAMVGLEAVARAPEFQGKRILYWHTLSSTWPTVAVAPESALSAPFARALGYV